MPTYAELAAEQWWGREVVTPELTWLGTELCRRTGRPRDAAGSKGDNRHLRGSHRSQEWIKHSRYCTNRSYTVQSGLTSAQLRHIAGFDFNPGSAAQMVAQSKRIIAAMRAGQLDEVLEFYGTVDGKTVTGWNNRENRYATSDSSHLWHWHISIDRRRCADRALMERILRIALGDTTTGEDDDVSAAEVWAHRSTSAETGVTAPAEAYLRVADVIRKVDLPRIEATLAAILAAVQGADTAAILARIDEVAAAEQARDAELRELVERGLSGELAADEVVRLMGERLTAGAGVARTGSE